MNSRTSRDVSGLGYLAPLPARRERAAQRQFVEAAVIEARRERPAHALLAVLRHRPQQPRQRARRLMTAALALQHHPQPSVTLAQRRGELGRDLAHRLRLA